MAIPVTDFSGDVLIWFLPLSVIFTDESTNIPTSRAWDFGDGVGTSVDQNPTYSYPIAGTYTVTLIATNVDGSDTMVKTDYITVLPPVPVAEFSADTTSGIDPLTVTFTDESINTPTVWEWNFWDGTPVSTDQNPVHIYSVPGTYDVYLKAENIYGYSEETKTWYITVLDDVYTIDKYHDEIKKFAYRLPTSLPRVIRKNLTLLNVEVTWLPVDWVLIEKYLRRLKRIFRSGYSYLVRELREELEDFVTELLTP